MDASWWNGEDNRDIPRHGSEPDHARRVAFQNQWLARHGLSRQTWTMAQVIQEQQAWEREPKTAIPRMPNLDRTLYCEHGHEYGNCVANCQRHAKKAS